MPLRVACALLVLFSTPLAHAERAYNLAVPGFRSAVVVAPSGEGKRPVVVALHGNFDRPEWNCETLPSLVEGRAWIVCIRGIPRTDIPKEYDRWTYPGRARVRAEIDAALGALEARFPGRVDPAEPVLAGFSLGAIIAARFAVAEPKRFPRLYLVEGSHPVWTPKSLRAFARGGGKGVLFGCGRPGCGAQSRRLCRALTGLDVWCDEKTVPELGHSYTEPLPERALPLFRTLVAPDPRWSPRSRP